MRLLLENTLALAVDYQERLVPAMSGREELIQRSVMLLEGLEILGVETLISQQYPKGLGHTVEEIVKAAPSAKYFDKMEFSCCDNEEIFKELEQSGRKYVIVCGMESHVCVLQTVVDLAEKGYTPILVADCIASRKESDKQIALRRAAAEGAVVTTAEAVLFELLRRAGGDTFKAISKLVK